MERGGPAMDLRVGRGDVSPALRARFDALPLAREAPMIQRVTSSPRDPSQPQKEYTSVAKYSRSFRFLSSPGWDS